MRLPVAVPSGLLTQPYSSGNDSSHPVMSDSTSVAKVSVISGYSVGFPVLQCWKRWFSPLYSLMKSTGLFPSSSLSVPRLLFAMTWQSRLPLAANTGHSVTSIYSRGSRVMKLSIHLFSGICRDFPGIRVLRGHLPYLTLCLWFQDSRMIFPRLCRHSGVMLFRAVQASPQ